MADEPDPLTVKFQFALDIDVRIVALKLKGHLVSRCERSPGRHEYLVIYWSDGARHDLWLRDFELEELPEHKK